MEDKEIKRKRRHDRIRKKIKGTPERPRVSVYRSLKHIYIQIIDDTKGITLASASTRDKAFADVTTNRSNIKMATETGKLIAERALNNGIKAVVFDRGGYKYHGCIKAIADAMREKGMDF
ncbi:MAG: 50S ribosomal protein L18 [Thermodesulfovibrionales bacterium]|nr:50S ribosomal protein L18 [Thermodesulfovibrionales bacterium]